MKQNKILIGLLFSLILTFTLPAPVEAQCPMCKLSAESNLKNGGKAGRGLNAGILYMFATPYLLVGGLAFVWWRYNRGRKDEELDGEGFVGIN
jgi:hypothetical protein